MTRFASPLFWTVGGYAASQVLRLMSNLIMARYLAPEDFGVMALIMVIIIGLQMFSDVGGSTYYIKSNDSEATSIANTVWTLRVLRGMGLFLICGLISWPISLVYKNPILFEVLPAMGIIFLISGVSSISVEKLERQMLLSRVTTLELFSQLISIFVMVAAARLFPSVWVLVLGAIVSATAKTIGSYVFLECYRHSFDLDKQKISKVARFGAWVFVSTALAFFTNSSASLVVGKVFDMGFLGLFSIGATLAKAVEQAYDLVSARLYFPVLARVRNAGEDIRATAYRLKWVSVLLFVVPSLVLFWFAHEIIAVLFDHRYSEAAWIFQLYIVGMLPRFVSGLGNFTLAFGDSKASASLSLVNFVLFFSCMLLGWYLFGEMGIVFAVALSGGFLYFFQIAWQEKYGLWFSWFDLAVYAVICIVLGLKIS